MERERDARIDAIPDIHGHAKGEHKPYAEERPLPLTARMLFLWFYHACRRGSPRFLMVSDHMNYLTFEDPASVNLVRRALKLAQAGDLYGAAETANVDVIHAQIVSEGLRRGMRYSIGAEVDNDPRARPDAQNIVEAMRPDGLIRSVHFIPIEHPVHGPNWNWPFDNPEFASLYEHVGTAKLWETYVGVLVDALERLPGNIVGHFYVPAVLGGWPEPALLEAYEDRMLAAAEARGMAVEFNTRFLYRDHSDEEKQRFLAANRRLLRKAKERGVGIAVGSDAHSPRDQGGAFEVVLRLLDELEINELVFPIAGRLARVALRYVKPVVPEPPVVVPVPEPAPVPTAALEPVRKARAGTSPARPKERPARTFEPSAPAPAPAPAPAARKAETEAARPKPAAAAKKAPPAAVKPRPAKPAPKPAAKLAKPAAKTKPARKAAVAKKTVRKAVAAKKSVAKKAPPRKVAAKKAPARKAAPKKTIHKKAARVVAKRAPAKKTVTRKPPPKKPAGKKAAAKRR